MFRPRVACLCVTALVASLGCAASAEPANAVDLRARAAGEADSRPSWEAESCGPLPQAEETGGRACTPRGSSEAVFHRSDGCGADFASSGPPCGRFLARDVPIIDARGSFGEAVLQARFSAEQLVEGEAKNFLCRCASELRALGYRVETHEQGMRADSEIDRLEIRAEAHRLVHRWVVLGDLEDVAYFPNPAIGAGEVR